jgi:hypothetical protein
MDKLYKLGAMPSTENTTTTFPQGTTGATLAENVRKSAEAFKPKIEMSST